MRWLFFNLFVGNNDSPAKNLALLATPQGLRLAPFYDLVSIRVYSGLAKHVAFCTLGGEGLQHQDGHSHLIAATIPNCKAYDPGLAGEYALAMLAEEGRVPFALVAAARERYRLAG